MERGPVDDTILALVLAEGSDQAARLRRVEELASVLDVVVVLAADGAATTSAAGELVADVVAVRFDHGVPCLSTF